MFQWRHVLTRTGIAGALGLGIAVGSLILLSCSANAQTTDPYLWNDRAPDPQFKADILVVVAHADDEGMVTPYLAREVFDTHRTVAVVYLTHSEGGNNNIGPEQAIALGEMREIEARRDLDELGIHNVWFLSGHDLASQSALSSLEYSDHGSCLGQLVRIMRLTRPTIVLTMLPDFMTGENHGDHQAAGILATEAFDMAGDPTAFPEQVSPTEYPDLNMNHLEGLLPWQPEKLYFFGNPTEDIFAGRGPQYSSQDISPSHHVSYGLLAARAFASHRTQGGDDIARLIESHNPDKLPDPAYDPFRDSVKLIFGKSLVPSAPTADVFAGVTDSGIPYHRAPGYTPAAETQPQLRLGDPWHFYQIFWRAHALDHLASLVPPEITVKVGGELMIPLIVDNPLDTPLQVTFSVQVPSGWKVMALDPVSVEAHSRYFLRVRATAPANLLPGWQHFVIDGQSLSGKVDKVRLRAELSDGWVAPQ